MKVSREEAEINRCPQLETRGITLQGGRKFFNRCLLDEGHQGAHNYQSHKGDEKMMRRMLNNRSERGMM